MVICCSGVSKYLDPIPLTVWCLVPGFVIIGCWWPYVPAIEPDISFLPSFGVVDFCCPFDKLIIQEVWVLSFQYSNSLFLVG